MDLSAILAPVPVAEFLTNFFGTQHLFVAGNPAKFASLFSWQHAFDAIGQPGTTFAWSGSEAPANVESFQQALTCGVTFEVDRAETLYSSLADLLLRLGRELCAPVTSQLRAGCGGWSEMQASCDLLILEIAGPRSFNIAGAPDPSVQLQSGDALYIPRGCTYASSPSTAPALELVLFIHSATGLDLMRWVVEMLAKNPTLQASVPRFQNPAAQVAFMTQLRRTIAATLRAPEVLNEYTRALDDNAPPLAGVRSPWAETLDDKAKIVLIAPRKLAIRRADADRTYIVCAGNQLIFPLDAVPLLHFLNDHQEAPVSSFYKEFDCNYSREDLADFLSVLAANLIIEFRPT